MGGRIAPRYSPKALLLVRPKHFSTPPKSLRSKIQASVRFSAVTFKLSIFRKTFHFDYFTKEKIISSEWLEKEGNLDQYVLKEKKKDRERSNQEKKGRRSTPKQRGKHRGKNYLKKATAFQVFQAEQNFEVRCRSHSVSKEKVHNIH